MAVEAIVRHYIYSCVGCGRGTYFLSEWWGAERQYKAINVHHESVPGNDVVHQYPVASPASAKGVPASVRDAAVEAEKCLASGAFNACGTMARRAVHAICADKGATGKDLYAQLADLKDKHVITPDLWEWADELRTAGKVGAHPEWEAMTEEEAGYAVRLLREVLRYVYINPAERAARKLTESKKKVP